MRKRGLLLLMAVALVDAGQTWAQTIDQSQQNQAALYVGRTGSDCTPLCVSNGWSTQSFRPTATTSAGAAFFLQPFASTSGTLFIDLWDNLPSASGANKLTGGTTALGAAAGYYTVWFPQLAVVIPGNQYFLAFFSAAQYNIRADYNVYAGGALNYNRSLTATSAYVGNQCCDAQFIEYSLGPTVVIPPTTTVPEPSSMVLMAAGLGAVAGLVRKRRAARV